MTTPPPTAGSTRGGPVAERLALLPLALVLILGLHLWLIRHLGVSATGTERALFRSHLRPLSGFALLFVAVVGIFAIALPHGLLASGIEGFEVTKPPWPFLWIYAAENLFGTAKDTATLAP